MWVGTDGDGVYKFLTRPKIFYSIRSGVADNGQLSHNIIRSVYEDPATGVLYVGTRGGGLNILSKNKKTSVLNTRNGLSNNAVIALNKDHNGNIWMGVDSEGIDMLDAKTNRVFHFPRDFENKVKVNFSSVYSICVDAFNDIWLGTSGFGVIHLKMTRTPRGTYQLDEFDEINHSGSSGNVLRSNIVYSIIEEKPNTLWFGTRGGGIYRYNSLTKKIEEHIYSNASDPVSLGNDDVLSMHIDQKDELWIGTSGGLNRLYLGQKPYRIERYTQRESLPNNTIHGVLEDNNENIWLSTNRGLVVYERQKKSFKTFNTNDGLQNNEFTDGAFFQSQRSQQLFFGGIEGLDIVLPSQISTNDYFPRLTVTDLQVRNVSIVPGDETKILKENIDFTDNITLNYDQNFITVAFTTLDYWNKQKSQYSYKLENFDKDWNFIGSRQSVTFTNISPGSYTLLLNYANENGKWSSYPKRFRSQ